MTDTAKKTLVIAVMIFIASAMGTCMFKFDQAREERKQQQAAYDAHVRKTCKLLERNRPDKSRRFDTFLCGDIIEWVER